MRERSSRRRVPATTERAYILQGQHSHLRNRLCAWRSGGYRCPCCLHGHRLSYRVNSRRLRNCRQALQADREQDAHSPDREMLGRRRERHTCIARSRTTEEPGSEKLHEDHIIPRSRGGNNTDPNRGPACQTCNLQKGARTPQEWYEWLQDRGGLL
jgi:5-methylcytosine-specific restriction endonuclease McrA